MGADGRELAHGRAPTPWRQVPTGAEVDPEALFGCGCGGRGHGPRRRSRGARAGCRRDQHGRGGSAARRARPGAISGHRLARRTRCVSEAKRIAAELGAERFSERTGLSASPLCTLAKLRWLLDHHPPARAGRRWLNVGEWVVRRLGGRRRGRAVAVVADGTARSGSEGALRRRSGVGRLAGRSAARAGARGHAGRRRRRRGVAAGARRRPHRRRPRPPLRRRRGWRRRSRRRARLLRHGRGARPCGRAAASPGGGAPQRRRRGDRRVPPVRGPPGAACRCLVRHRPSGGLDLLGVDAAGRSRARRRRRSPPLRARFPHSSSSCTRSNAARCACRPASRRSASGVQPSTP